MASRPTLLILSYSDLGRDPRILLHSVVAAPNPGGEIMMRGTARPETGTGVQQRYAEAAALRSRRERDSSATRRSAWSRSFNA